MNDNPPFDSPIRVAIVDDHDLFVDSFSNTLNSFAGIHAHLLAHDGVELLESLKSTAQKPHIILMDVNMPNMNGIEATRQVSAGSGIDHLENDGMVA